MKRIVLSALVLVSLCWGDAAKRDAYVMPRRDGVGVYANRGRALNEKAVTELGEGDRAVILKKVDDRYQVRLADGTEGWVEVRLVKRVGASMKVTFGNAVVNPGSLDDPTLVVIIGVNDPPESGILLTRSFNDALRENTDRETVERSSE